MPSELLDYADLVVVVPSLLPFFCSPDSKEESGQGGGADDKTEKRQRKRGREEGGKRKMSLSPSAVVRRNRERNEQFVMKERTGKEEIGAGEGRHCPSFVCCLDGDGNS